MKIKTQFLNFAPVLVAAYAITTAILSIVIFLGVENDIELDHFTQDPAAIMDTPYYLGFFSYIGILFWCGAAVLCFFTYLLLPTNNENRNTKSFLLYSGLITSLLMFDDLFLLHEEVLPKYFFLPENVVYIIYVNIIILYLVLFRNKLIQTEYFILIIASGLIGSSQFFDLLPMPIPEDSFLEDAVKLFGIVTWFTYYSRFCYQKLVMLKK